MEVVEVYEAVAFNYRQGMSASDVERAYEMLEFDHYFHHDVALHITSIYSAVYKKDFYVILASNGRLYVVNCAALM